jgi:c-di-GMP-binding flagellar brake protein YcgR
MGWTIERKHPRVRAALPGEIHRQNEEFALRAQTIDISLGGCYLEMLYTLAPATKAELILWIDGIKMRARVEVVTQHAQVGNGFKFLDIPETDRVQLSKYLDSALGRNQFHQA